MNLLHIVTAFFRISYSFGITLKGGRERNGIYDVCYTSYVGIIYKLTESYVRCFLFC